MRDGTYAEQLRSVSELYKIELRIISTLGAQLKTDILPSFSSFWRTILGHLFEALWRSLYFAKWFRYSSD